MSVVGAASWTLRAILRNAVFGQHLAFIGHVAQSVCQDRKMMVLALVTCERPFLKALHSLRNGLPVGQRYPSALFISMEIVARKTVVLALGLVPHRHMRFDVFLLQHPGQHRRGTLSGVANVALRLDVELRFDPIDHVLVPSTSAVR